MIKKYFRLLKEVEDLKAKIESTVGDIEAETGQIIVTSFFNYSLNLIGTDFSTYFSDDGTWSTHQICESNDIPETVDAAVEKAKEMFKAKDEWERLLVKIDEVLKEQ